VLRKELNYKSEHRMPIWSFARQPEKKFVNGFLHKKIKPKSLRIENIEPTYAEVELFLNKATKGEKEIMLDEYSKL